MTQAGLAGKAYVYGFDEVPHTPQWIHAINQILGVRIMLSRIWPDMPHVIVMKPNPSTIEV